MLRSCRRGLPLRGPGGISSSFRPLAIQSAHHYSSRANVKPGMSSSDTNALKDIWNSTRFNPLTPASESEEVLTGFLGKQRKVGKSLCFADLATKSGELVQISSNISDSSSVHEEFCRVPAHSPVSVRVVRDPPDSGSTKQTVALREIRAHNTMSKEHIVSRDSVFPPSQRHLQIRFHAALQARLRFRSWLKGVLNQGLLDRGFVDVETPILFKSTPEGAKEFLVPTRNLGTAYALSQSPQQYKQILMASGIERYMQWARCFRDEDLRADRQPEFSQLDLEWAFAKSSHVMADVTSLILDTLYAICPAQSYTSIQGSRIPEMRGTAGKYPPTDATAEDAHTLTTITYADSIAAYGTDKPDLRIPNRIHAVDDLEPISHFVQMITNIPDPMVEFCAFHLEDCRPKSVRKFVADFMSSLPTPRGQEAHSTPQVLVYDSGSPNCGFSSLGPEYEKILGLGLAQDKGFLKDGDIVIFQARERPSGLYHPGSTKLGALRAQLWKELVAAGLMDKPVLGEPGSLRFAWVTEFPMFKPFEKDEAGQGGAAGISACHHPFTAPLSDEDFDLLFTEPLKAKSAAYDLVLNGVEVGGGSERIHVAELQRFIMGSVLRMPEQSIDRFSHLFAAFDAGCPPHAGFALGLDRLVALLTDTTSVRDVIAFPKTMQGEDVMVKSPGPITDDQLASYGLKRF